MAILAMTASWKRPEETTEFPPTGTHVFAYVYDQENEPFLVPALGISLGTKIVGIGSGTKVAWWLSGVNAPPSLPKLITDE